MTTSLRKIEPPEVAEPLPQIKAETSSEGEFRFFRSEVYEHLLLILEDDQ
jgi:hypothetical protein